MNIVIGAGKKAILKRQYLRQQEAHLQRIKNARPNTSNLGIQDGYHILNQKKKQMLKQDKFTQIERQNRHLLQKITFASNRLNKRQNDRQKMNKSLNSCFRKKQLEGIQIQNARLLRRIQQKKSDYEAEKLKKQWIKQKEVIKNIANFPFIIKDHSRRNRRRAYSNAKNLQSQQSQALKDYQLVRIRNINGENMIITVVLTTKHLKIYADNKKQQSVKIIQIPRQEGLSFIKEECKGKLQNIFDRLHYNSKKQTLYLVGDNAQQDFQSLAQQHYS